MTTPYLPDNFDWSEIEDQARIIKGEILGSKIYDYWIKVTEGDIVVDIGASVGPFTYTALQRKAKKVYAVEPSPILLKTLIKNNSEFLFDGVESPLVCINRAISDVTNEDITSDPHVNVFGSDKSFKSLTFKDLISRYNIDYIDFLKIDCEGGEYSIFTEENIEFLTTRVKFIVCEFHSRDNMDRFHNFLNLKDTFLSQVNCQIRCGHDPVTNFPIDLIPFINDHHTMLCIMTYGEVMVWIHNSDAKPPECL